MSEYELTAEELEARSEALAGGCSLVAPGGHCDKFTSVVLWGGEYVGFNDRSETSRKWDGLGEAELMLTQEDRRRIERLLIEAGQKLQAIQAIAETYRERLIADAATREWPVGKFSPIGPAYHRTGPDDWHEHHEAGHRHEGGARVHVHRDFPPDQPPSTTS